MFRFKGVFLAFSLSSVRSTNEKTKRIRVKKLINRKAKLYDKKNVITDEKLCVCVWWTWMSVYDRIENKVIMIVENEKSWKRAKAWEWICISRSIAISHTHCGSNHRRTCVCVCVFLCIEHGKEMWNLDIFGWKFFKHFWVYNRICCTCVCVCLWLCVCTSVRNVCGRNDWQKNMQNQEPNILYTQKEGQKHTHTHTHAMLIHLRTHSRYTVCRLDEKWKKCS